MFRTLTSSFALLPLLLALAFQAPPPKAPPPEPPKAPAQDPPKPTEPPKAPGEEPREQRLRNPKAALRITALPGVDKEKLAKQYEPVVKWLSAQVTRPVEIVPVADVEAAVTALATDKADLIWTTGLGSLQAVERARTCQAIFAREEDVKHKSYFVASKKLVDAGKLAAAPDRAPMTLEALAALKPALAELTFTFAEARSTGGHLMPRHFLERSEVALDTEKGFKKPAAIAASGGEAGVLAAVAAGSFDVGAVGSAAWEQAAPELKAQLAVVYVTPEYPDGCFVIYHSRNSPGMLPLRITGGFLQLKPEAPADKQVLDAFGTKKFVAVGPVHFEPLRAIVQSLKDRKLY